MANHTLADIIQGYRELADFLEGHAAILPQGMERYSRTFNGVSLDTSDEVAALAKTGGRWEKTTAGNYFYIIREFAGGVKFYGATDREHVCRRIVVGTDVIPAQPEHEVERVEWHCDQPLLGADHEKGQHDTAF